MAIQNGLPWHYADVVSRLKASGSTGASLVAVSTLLLSGCTHTPEPTTQHTSVRPTVAPRVTTPGTPTPAPKPTLTPEAAGQVVVPAAETDVDPSHAPYDVIEVPGQELVGRYTNYVFPVQIPHDDGPMKYAEGTVITEGSRIVAYQVAPGDIYDYIAKRFHLTNNGYLLVLNEPRRGEASSLYAGDVLNLSAFTLDKYGTVNGRVARGPQPIAAPKQET